MKAIKRKYMIVPYSLIELLAAMTVFAVLMLALMQFLSSAQKIWTGSNAKNIMFEDARIAMNLMARDLNEIFYTESLGGFSLDTTGDNKMAFSTRIDGKPNPSCKSNIAIVTWEYDSTNNLLKRQVKGDVAGAIVPAYSSLGYSTIAAELSPANSTEVIERVVGFSIGAYKKSTDFSSSDSTIGGGYIPSLVTLSISLLDKNSYDKWKASGELAAIKNNNMRTFSKYIFIGDRGQREE